MIDKDVSKITIEDIQYLIENSVIENKRLEYKRELHVDKDSDKKEFIADVSSFANASGGKILYGITENRNDGTPEKMSGIEVDNIDQKVQKLENIIKTGIEPRIPSIEIKPLKYEKSNYILLIDIPKSFLSPHRVIYKSQGHFYSRTTNGKYQLDVSELRNAFTFSEAIIKKVHNFRLNRVSQIAAGEMPIEFIKSSKCVLHLIPLISFDPTYSTDLSIVVDNSELTRPIYCMGSSCRYNFEGYLSYYRIAENNTHTYVQIFKNGIIEAVNGKLLGDQIIPSLTFEGEILRAFKTYYSLLQELKIPLPFIVSLTLIDVKGHSMGVSSSVQMFHEVNKIDREILMIPEELVENYDTNADKILKPIFDSIWNACGFAFSTHYDKDGNWVGK